MARPCKRRRICGKPPCAFFGPEGEKPDRVVMTLDEFETIRLIDWEGLTQEQCAGQMDVARTTVQAIYGSARSKVAECLVLGKGLRIEGGEYRLCDGTRRGCRRPCPDPLLRGAYASRGGADCRATGECVRKERTGGDFEMKIAVTFEEGKIFQHFGHTEQFKIYDVENGTIVGSQVVDTQGQGHGALAGFLQEFQVTDLICGGIGGGARQALAEAGIRLYGGVTGDADQAAQALAEGKLSYDPDAECSHHGEGHHGGSCGHHGEGHEGCGHHGNGERCGHHGEE